MRRIITLLLALSMIIAAGFVLSSCDAVNQFVPGEKEDVITVEDGYLVVNGVKTEYKVLVEEENPDNTENGNGNQNGENTENGGTGNEVRTTVTAEEFEANMNQTNYTMSFEVEATYLQEPAYTGMVMASATAIYADLVSIGISPAPYYVVKQDDVWYGVIESENGWIGQVGNISDENAIVPLVACVSIFNLDHTYDSLVYDTEKKAYTFTQEVEDGWQMYCYYFEEGKIIKCEMLDTDSYGNGRITLSISNIGTTVIEVPEFTVE